MTKQLFQTKVFYAGCERSNNWPDSTALQPKCLSGAALQQMEQNYKNEGFKKSIVDQKASDALMDLGIKTSIVENVKSDKGILEKWVKVSIYQQSW